MDLMQVETGAGTIVYVAHDGRLAAPEGLVNQFKPTTLGFAVNGRPMNVFEHRAHHDESLTLGSNTVNAGPASADIYLVFLTEDTGPA